MLRGRPAPSISPDALRHGRTLPEAPTTKTPERPPEHLRYTLPGHQGGQMSKRKETRNYSDRHNSRNKNHVESFRLATRSFHLLQFCWQCEEVDRDMDFIMAVVKTIRSLRSDYKLTKTAADCK